MEDNRKVMEALESEATEEKLFPNEQERELNQPISEGEFRKQIHESAVANYQKVLDDFKHGVLHLRDYSGINKFKSIRRAIRRGHVSIYGDVYPDRPFNNKKRGPGTTTYIKRKIYEQLTHKHRAIF